MNDEPNRNTSVAVTGGEVLRIRRGAVLTGIVVAVGGLVGLSVAGYPQAGIGACVGVAFGVWMFNSLVRTALSVPEEEVASAKKKFIASRVVRLIAVSIGVIVLTFADHQVGLGSLGGLAAFQMGMLLSSLRVMRASLALAGGAGGGAVGGVPGAPGADGAGETGLFGFEENP